MVTLVLTVVSTAATVAATYFAVLAAQAGRDATKLSEDLLNAERQVAELNRDAIELQRRNRWVSALQETAEWVAEIADRARRVIDGQPQYLLIHAVNRLQAILVFLPQDQFSLPVCRQLSQTHHRPEEASKLFVNALAEVEAAVGNVDITG